MSKLSAVSRRYLIKRLRQLGFQGPYQGGKHPYMERENVVVTIPNPHRSDIGVDLLYRILRRAGVSREEWLEQEND
ncbi:MAG: type II toxin-antitoxin system HicA family toxin [Cyanobacteriota bacterium]|nr:type II toxin-antitoxin system HicA family toxin [Cyanobacteriota bacterium]